MKLDPRRYSHERFNHLVAETVQQINKLSELKGGEYAGDDDRLANFRRNADALGLSMESVWAVYCAKHWDAVMQYVQDLNAGKTRTRLESLSSRCDDIIVYMILFKAMLDESESAQDTTGTALDPNAEGTAVSDNRMKLSLKDMALSGKSGPKSAGAYPIKYNHEGEPL